MKAIDDGRFARNGAAGMGLNPDDAQFGAILRRVGEVMLISQAVRRYADSVPTPELLERLQHAGPLTTGAMLASWGMPPEMGARFVVSGPDGTAAEGPMSELLADPAGVGAAFAGLASTVGVDPGVLIRACRDAENSTLVFSVGASFPGTCTVFSQTRRLDVRPVEFTEEGVQVVLDTTELADAASLFGGAGVQGLWFELQTQRGNAHARAPIEVVSWEEELPVKADLRFIGVRRHGDRVRQIAFLAVNRRRSVRVAVDDRAPILVALQDLHESPVGEAILMDASTSGLGVIFDPSLSQVVTPGTELIVRLVLPTRAEELVAIAKVMHVEDLTVEDQVSSVRYHLMRAGMSLRAVSGSVNRIESGLAAYVMRRQREELRRRR